jgi:predicted DNA-binding transcriptional regulator YafY
MLMESYRTSLTGLKENEVRALFMFTVPGLLADLGAAKDSESAFLKLTASLPAPFQQDAKIVQERLFLDPAAWFQPEEKAPFLPLLQEAVFASKKVRLVYRRSDGQWIKRLIEPYGLVAKAGVWYVVAAVYATKPKVFRISRIQEAAISNSHFQRPSTFNLADFWTQWSSRFETEMERFQVTVRVEEQAINRFVRFYGESLFERLNEPGVTDNKGAITLTLTFDSMASACEQLLGLGTAVEIIAPLSLREHLRQTAVEIAAFYSQPLKP